MKKSYRSIFIRCGWLLFAIGLQDLQANIAMPGFFNVGGNGSYQLFYPGDSTALEHVSMQEEWISIRLYQGYAVVRGEYEMYNASDSSLSLRVGYPIHSIYAGNSSEEYFEHFEVNLDSLYGLQVWINGSPVSTDRLENEMEKNSYAEEWDQVSRQASNWQVWEAEFAPKEVTRIEVCFLVNTGPAKVVQGYNVDYINGFVYLLESGRAWAGDIGKGHILVELADGLKLENVHGLRPVKGVKEDNNTNRILWEFESLEPGPKDNFLISYGDTPENWDFLEGLGKGMITRDCPEANTIKEVETSTFTSANRPDLYEPRSKVGGMAVGFLMYAAIYGVPLLFAVGIGFMIFVLWRKFRRK